MSSVEIEFFFLSVCCHLLVCVYVYACMLFNIVKIISLVVDPFFRFFLTLTVMSFLSYILLFPLTSRNNLTNISILSLMRYFLSVLLSLSHTLK